MQGKTILIVDDDLSILDSLQLLFEEEGYSVQPLSELHDFTFFIAKQKIQIQILSILVDIFAKNLISKT